MIQTLVLTHGNLAQALLETAERISGPHRNLSALALDWNDAPERLRRRLEERIDELDEGQGVLILTDLYGDTPSNLALSLVDPGRVEVVAGVNLPMVLRLSCLGDRAMDVSELATWIRDKGKQGVRMCTAAVATERD